MPAKPISKNGDGKLGITRSGNRYITTAASTDSPNNATDRSSVTATSPIPNLTRQFQTDDKSWTDVVSKGKKSGPTTGQTNAARVSVDNTSKPPAEEVIVAGETLDSPISLKSTIGKSNADNRNLDTNPTLSRHDTQSVDGTVVSNLTITTNYTQVNQKEEANTLKQDMKQTIDDLREKLAVFDNKPTTTYPNEYDEHELEEEVGYARESDEAASNFILKYNGRHCSVIKHLQDKIRILLTQYEQEFNHRPPPDEADGIASALFVFLRWSGDVANSARIANSKRIANTA